MRTRSIWPLVLALAAGCGGNGEPPVGELTGTVTTGGNKLTGGNIKFTPEGGGAPISANIGYEGNYRTTMVPPGDYKVTVETAFLTTMAKIPGGIAAAPPEKGTKGAKKADPGPQSVQVPRRYEKVGETTLKLTVKPGAQTADFDCP